MWLRLTFALGLVLASGCGGRSALRTQTQGSDEGTGGAGSASVTTGTSVTTGSTSSTGSGGGPACAVQAFAGDRTGGVRIAMDATHVYWTTREGRLQRGSLETGLEETLLEDFASGAAIALTDTHVYVANVAQILRIPKGGGEYESLAPGNFIPVDLLVDGETAYLLDRGGGILDSVVHRFTPEQGITEWAIGFGIATAMTADATDVYVLADGAVIREDFVSEALLRIARSDGVMSVIATGVTQPFGVQVDDAEVYWGEGVNDEFDIAPRLLRKPKLGGSAIAGPPFAASLPIRFAIDESFAYVTVPVLDLPDGPTLGRLFRVSLSEGSSTLLLEEASRFFTEPAVNATHVAFTVQHPTEGHQDGLDDVRVLCKP